MTVDVLLTPTGARGAAVDVSRAERSRRTADLVAAAHEAGRDGDLTERNRLLDEVVLLNCRVADAVAMRYRDRGVPVEDLVQVAYEGLVKAVRSFDIGQGHDLLTFAVPTIRGEVQRYFRDRSWMVRPPRRVQELQGRINAAIDRLGSELGREPSADEVCRRVGIDQAEYDEVVAAFGCFRPVSLDNPVHAGSSRTVGWALGELLTSDGIGERDATEARCVVGPALRRLSPDDRHVLRLRFVDEHTQREIGEELGLTQTQVSRRIERIVRDLRRMIGPLVDASA